MPTSARRVRTATAWSLALVLMLTACGGGTTAPASTAAPTSASAASLSATLQADNARLAAQTSFVVTTTGADGSTSTEVRSGGAASLDQHDQMGHLEAITTGQAVWVRIDNADLWRLELGQAYAPPSAGSVDPASLVGRWVLVTGTQVAHLAPHLEPPALFEHPDDTTLAGHSSVGGVATVEYRDPVGLESIFMTTTSAPLPVEVKATASGVNTVATYGEFGTAPAVQPPDPAGVVDGTSFAR